MALTNLVKTIQNIMRKDTGVDGDAQRISQLTWMLFLKIFDDKEQEYELLDSNYKSPLPESLRWRNWAKDDAGITGDELIDFINNKLFPGLKEMNWQEGDDPRGYIVKEVFQDSYNYMKSGTFMRQVINVIDNEIDFNNSKQTHIFNDIYEKLLKDLQSAGNAGEFYTPRAVTKFIVEMVDPKLGEKILDPACGTGGFLIDSLTHVRENDVKTPEDEKVLQSSIYGIEKKPLPHMLAMTNLILHGIEAPLNVRRDNSLAVTLREITAKDRVDVVVTNPPFGGIEADNIAKGFPKQYQTKETADLFLVLIMEMLKDGGRAGVVLPDGFLFGEGVKTRIKQELLEKFNLHTIVKLPNGVFSPYTSISTNLLFFEKGKPTKDIWFFEVPLRRELKNGYTKSKQFTIKELDIVKSWWVSRQKSNHAWSVSISEVKSNNYNLDFKNPSNMVKTHALNTDLIIKKINNDLQNIDTLFAKFQHALHTKDVSSSELKINDIEVQTLKDKLKLLRKSILNDAVTGQLLGLNKSKHKEEVNGLLIPENWRWVTLPEIVNRNESYPIKRGPFGSSLRKEYFVDAGYKVYEQKNAIQNDFEIGTYYIDEDKYNELKAFTVKPGDIIISCSGTIGKTAIVPEGAALGVINQALLKVSLDSKVCLNDYFVYMFEAYFVSTEGIKGAKGSAIKNVASVAVLKNTPIPLPPIDEQRQIVQKVDELLNYVMRIELMINSK